MDRGDSLTLVIPAYNEQEAIGAVLEDARTALDGLSSETEIIVVDDCSTDRTAEIAASRGARVLRNVQNSGYGYSLMRGIQEASFPNVAIVDADGSYPLHELPKMIEEYRRGFAMVVAQRYGEPYMRNRRIRFLRVLFRTLTQLLAGRSVPDVNSGMRIFERDRVLPLFPHLSYGFSFTTSVTLLFLLRALPVSYVPVPYRKRRGSSKVRYFRDSLRALQILVSVTARLNPIKLFLLAAMANLLLMAPLLLLFASMGNAAVPITIVLAVSALLVGLGFVVEALIDKSQFDVAEQRPERSPR